MKKILFIFCLSGFFFQLIAEEKVASEKKHYLNNWELSVGSNYSQFTTTKDDGQFGLNFSVYRNFRINKKLRMKAGFCYSRVFLQAKDKTIRTHSGVSYDESGTPNYKLINCSTIDFIYDLNELNLIFYYPLFKYKSFSISPLVGFGFCAIKGVDENKEIAWIKESDDYFTDGLYPVDYEQYDETTMAYKNSGLTTHIGINLRYKYLFMDYYYSNYLHKMERNTTRYIEIDEKMSAFNVMLGIIL